MYNLLVNLKAKVFGPKKSEKEIKNGILNQEIRRSDFSFSNNYKVDNLISNEDEKILQWHPSTNKNSDPKKEMIYEKPFLDGLTEKNEGNVGFNKVDNVIPDQEYNDLKSESRMNPPEELNENPLITEFYYTEKAKSKTLLKDLCK